MNDAEIDRVATFFIVNKRFLDYLESDNFEVWLRQRGLLDRWRENKTSTEIKHLTQGYNHPKLQDYFNEFLRYSYNIGGRELVANICLWVASGFALFDPKKSKKTIEDVLNIVIPSLGFKMDIRGQKAQLVKIDEKDAEEILIENEFESLLFALGEEFLESRRKAWNFVKSENPTLIKNAIDEHRRLFDNVLWSLAPDAEVMKSVFYDPNKHEKNKTKPFRNERIKYILSNFNYKEKEMEAVESICNTITNLYELWGGEIHLLKDFVKEARFTILMGEKILYLLISKHKEKHV